MAPSLQVQAYLAAAATGERVHQTRLQTGQVTTQLYVFDLILVFAELAWDPGMLHLHLQVGYPVQVGPTPPSPLTLRPGLINIYMASPPTVILSSIPSLVHPHQADNRTLFIVTSYSPSDACTLSPPTARDTLPWES